LPTCRYASSNHHVAWDSSISLTKCDLSDRWVHRRAAQKRWPRALREPSIRMPTVNFPPSNFRPCGQFLERPLHSHLSYNGGVLIARRVSFLPLLLSFAVFGATGIREIDFKNLDYAWDAPKLSAPNAWKWLEGRPKSSARVIGGKCDLSPSDSPAGTYRGDYLSILSVTYGDLNGDGQDDAAVDVLYSTGGSLYWHYVYVFTLQNGLPKLLGRLQSGARADGGLVKVAISEDMLVLEFADTRRRIADCCSEGYVRVKYRWQEGRFVESGKREFGDLDRGRR
jgi:hypothetical protein